MSTSSTPPDNGDREIPDATDLDYPDVTVGIKKVNDGRTLVFFHDERYITINVDDCILLDDMQ